MRTHIGGRHVLGMNLISSRISYGDKKVLFVQSLMRF